MEGRVGVVEPGASADFAVFRVRADDPYENLCASHPEDLERLTVEAVPVFGDEAKYGDFFAHELKSGGYGRIVMDGRTMFVKGDPALLYKNLRTLLGFAKKLDYLPFEP
jgi:hypothetical protein